LEVRFAFLCDSVEDRPQGTLDARGVGIDFLHIGLDPAQTYVRFCLVMQVVIGEADGRLATIDFEFRGDVVPAWIEESVEVQLPEPNPVAGSRIVADFNIRFPAYDNYLCNVIVNGTRLVSLPLAIMP
jgi:hypothetical protein